MKELVTVQVARGSLKAKRILENWAGLLLMFWQVIPPSEAGSAEAMVVEESVKELART